MIFLQREYLNDAGEAILEHVPVAESSGESGAEKRSYFVMLTHVVNTSQGPVQDRFRADIDASTVADAFGKLPEIIKKAGANRIAQLQAMQRQVVLPNGQMLPPKGKPKTVIA